MPAILKQTFDKLRAEGRAAFMPYITAGDPDPEASWRLLGLLVKSGADAIELGVPFTDPMADGPDHQKAAARALRRPYGLGDALAMARRAWQESRVPVVLFSYYNSVLNYGLERLSREGKGWLAGVVVPDLPVEEAGALKRALAAAGAELIQLVAPTTPAARRRKIIAAAGGFVYYVSLTGVTGRRKELAAGLAGQLADLRKGTRLPIAVGFGISTPRHAGAVARLADGVIVGSALSSLAERHRGRRLEREFASLARRLARAVHRARRRA